MPALLTKMSICPYSSNVLVTKLSTSDLLVTSVLATITFVPNCSTLFAKFCAASGLASAITTLVPSLTKPSTMASPSPLSPPLVCCESATIPAHDLHKNLLLKSKGILGKLFIKGDISTEFTIMLRIIPTS